MGHTVPFAAAIRRRRSLRAAGRFRLARPVRSREGLADAFKPLDAFKPQRIAPAIGNQIGGIAEKLNFYTAEPVNQTKTVRFDLSRSEDNTTMSNATVMLFPSAPNPTLELYITLADNSIHKLTQTLNSSLSANTLLTLNVVIGEILPEGNPGDFTITDWNEESETIEFPTVE